MMSWWIGFTDIEEEGSFVWSDGATFAPGDGPNWSSYQPDNLLNDADCAVIAHYFDYKWDDVPCQQSLMGTLCERYIGLL